MAESALIGLRALQYVTAAIVLGVPALMIYSAAAVGELKLPWARPAAGWAAGLLAMAAAAGLAAQTAVMTGSPSEALRPEILGMMISGTTIGAAYVVRIGLALAATIIALSLPPARPLWWALTGLGVLIAASFAWTGHGAATEGAWRWPHLIADIVHSVAAMVWIGALAAFAMLLSYRAEARDRFRTATARALGGFARIGTIAVATLVGTGLVNLLALVGFDALGQLVGDPYGALLGFKLLAFTAMLVLAAVNRFRLTPAFERSGAGRLRWSVGVELTLGIIVLGLVAVMGVLPPPTSP